MGTHPIFESDFDCLTEMLNEAEQVWTSGFALIILCVSRECLFLNGRAQDAD